MAQQRAAMRAARRPAASAWRAVPNGLRVTACAPLLLALGTAAWTAGAAAQGMTAPGSSATADTGIDAATAGSVSGGVLGGVGPTGTASNRPKVTVVPSVSLSQTVVRGDSRASGDQRFDAVTQVRPGVSVAAGGRRLNGFLDYAFDALYDAKGDTRGDIRHALNSSVKAELVDDRLFLDASANISQQLVSALGQQYAADDPLNRGNRSQVKSYTVAPYLRGAVFRDAVRYDLRLSHAATHTGTALVGNSSGDSAKLRFTGGTGLSSLTWGLTGTRDVLDFDAGRRTTSDRGSGDLGYLVTPQFNVSARAGVESSDLVTADKQTSTTWGAGAGWRPSPVTSLSLQFERRAYGNTHAIIFSHRTARTVWTLSDTRSVAAPDAQRSVGRVGSLYDLLSALPQYAALDTAQRDAAVRAALGGLPANTQVLADFVNSAAISQRQQLLSVGWIGLRDTATLAVSQNRSDRVDRQSSPFALQSSANTIVQRGISASLAHRLTPLSSLSLTAEQQRNRGDGGSGSTRLTTADLTWSSQFGRNTSATLRGRRSNFSGVGQSYTETAITGTLALRF